MIGNNRGVSKHASHIVKVHLHQFVIKARTCKCQNTMKVVAEWDEHNCKVPQGCFFRLTRQQNSTEHRYTHPQAPTVTERY